MDDMEETRERLKKMLTILDEHEKLLTTLFRLINECELKAKGLM
ncbi:MAG: hypothetical protein Q8O92_16240 [Candidatus Latescibacter sp.]|nr:hypothetical protein [Candidatus Latescibacter sp.]